MNRFLTFIIFFFLNSPLLVSAQDAYYASCNTPSGKSIYDIALPKNAEEVGEIRLRFDGQDTLYSAKVKIVGNSRLTGVAKFKSSATGETDAKPWVFTYDISTNTLIDDGRLNANCE